MRLIDLDYALEDLNRQGSYPNDYPERWLEELPRVNAVKVVRCCNCIHFHQLKGNYTECDELRIRPDRFGYCYLGRRKE